MTAWAVVGALVLLVALASLVAAEVGGGSTPRDRDRRRQHRRPTPYRRCPTCRIPATRLPVVCAFNDCPEVKPIKMTYAEYLDISDHLK